MALWGLTDTDLSKPKYLNRGQIVAINITDGGSEYAEAPAVTISAPAEGTQATAEAVISEDGVVVAVNIINPGAGYTEDDEVTVTFASGDAAATAVYHGAMYSDGTIYFVDREESTLVENRARGLTSPGWWLYTTYQDNAGNTRHKAELLVAVDVTAADAGDADDDIVVIDRGIFVTVAQNVVTIDDGGTGALAATASSKPAASLNLRWQINNGTWTDVTASAIYSGVTTNTLTITAPDYSLNGKQYRLKASATGFTTVYSAPITLTVTPATLSFVNTLDAVTSGTVGGTVSFDLRDDVATAPVSGLAVTYLWEKSDDGTTWTALTQPVDPAYYVTDILTADDNGDTIRCTVSRDGATSISTQSIILTETTLSFGEGGTFDAITNAPLGGTVSFDLTYDVVTSPVANMPVTYTWEKSDDSGATWSALTPTENPAYYTTGILTADDNGDIIRCTISRPDAVSISTQTTLVVA